MNCERRCQKNGVKKIVPRIARIPRIKKGRRGGRGMIVIRRRKAMAGQGGIPPPPTDEEATESWRDRIIYRLVKKRGEREGSCPQITGPPPSPGLPPSRCAAAGQDGGQGFPQMGRGKVQDFNAKPQSREGAMRFSVLAFCRSAWMKQENRKKELLNRRAQRPQRYFSSLLRALRALLFKPNAAAFTRKDILTG